MGGFAQEVTIDKENCTITKDGKTFPLYGEIEVVESGNADLEVKILDNGIGDLEVRFIENGIPTTCGEWKILSSGIGDFTVRFVENGSADLEVIVIKNGTSGFPLK